MLLYHGTSGAILPRLKREGIAPRAKTKAKDNWKHTVTSNKDAVYLTDAYPWHFAAHASRMTRSGLILEIDMDCTLPWLLCPDEDFLEQATRKQTGPGLAPTDWSMKKRTMHYRKTAKFNAGLAAKSLEHMGTAAYYGVIPWKAVRRYVLIDWKKLHFEMHLRAVDSMVSMLNYQILQDRHRAFIRWFFGDPVTAEQILGHEIYVTSPDEKLTEHLKTQRWAMEQVMAKRDGLTVVNTKQVETSAA